MTTQYSLFEKQSEPVKKNRLVRRAITAKVVYKNFFLTFPRVLQETVKEYTDMLLSGEWTPDYNEITDVREWYKNHGHYASVPHTSCYIVIKKYQDHIFKQIKKELEDEK